MKNLYLIFFSFFISTGVFAQYENLKASADKAFNSGNYYQAAYYYDQLATGKIKTKRNIPFYASSKLLKKQIDEEHLYLWYQLAESYRLYQDYMKAQGWYGKILTDSAEADYPLARLWYGVCLRANKNFDEAVKQLRQFKASYKGESQVIDLANREVENCLFAKDQYGAATHVKVIRMGGQWNADGGSYALIKRAGSYWFTSSRLSTGDKVNSNHIYMASAEASSQPSIVPLELKDSRRVIEFGSPSFDRLHNRLYLTGWYRDGSEIVSAIYYTSLQNKVWSPMQELDQNVNAAGYNAMQPFVTADGKSLFFVSDRSGGEGGYDVWVSSLDDNGDASAAINLGKTINTSSDDESPFYDIAHKRLIYSSKGFTGLGGFDIFESYQNNGRWSPPVNMGYPVNSSKDDLYYFADPDTENKFYVSSDRESECCLSLFEGNYRMLSIAGSVVDCDSDKILSDVKVSLIDSASGQSVKNTVTGANAWYTFNGVKAATYKLLFEKAGYFNKSASLTVKMGSDSLFHSNVCLQAFKINKPIVIKNILYDFNRADLRPESKRALDGVVSIMVDNPAIKIELASHTDSVGSDGYNLKLSQLRAQSCVDYIISRGIDKSRIVAVGYGKNKPVAPNSRPGGQDNPEGRQLNRRTEFTVKE